jgi:hypothetical protein
MIQSLTQMPREGVGKENLQRKGVTISFFGFINKSLAIEQSLRGLACSKMMMRMLS